MKLETRVPDFIRKWGPRVPILGSPSFHLTPVWPCRDFEVMVRYQSPARYYSFSSSQDSRKTHESIGKSRCHNAHVHLLRRVYDDIHVRTCTRPGPPVSACIIEKLGLAWGTRLHHNLYVTSIIICASSTWCIQNQDVYRQSSRHNQEKRSASVS